MTLLFQDLKENVSMERDTQEIASCERKDCSMSTTQYLERGLVQIYTGDGKGKTTAALGLAFRAAGHGLRTCIVQFLKGTGYSGELESSYFSNGLIDIYQFGRACPRARNIRLGIEKCDACGKCFVSEDDITEQDTEDCNHALTRAKEAVYGGQYSIVVLDEVAHTLKLGLISDDAILELISTKPRNVELVLTGRGFSSRLQAAADLITNMHMIKHPFDKGFDARRGIEY